MKRRTIAIAALQAILMLAVIFVHARKKQLSAEVASIRPASYIPLVSRAWSCGSAFSGSYSAGPAFQFDLDNPVRPAWNHADKNLALRGYSPNNDSNLQRQLVNYGSDDPNQPPQFATLFNPARVPELIGFYRVNKWTWAPSPNPGWRGEPTTVPRVTAMGLKTNPAEIIRVPTSGYDIGGGMEVLVLFADEDSVTLQYTREDSAGAPGYTVFIDNICTSSSLLDLYWRHDDPNGPRYQYVPPERRPYSYGLPNLPAGAALGLSLKGEVVVAISDTGRFWDPRSCNEWWQIRPGYSRACPNAN